MTETQTAKWQTVKHTYDSSSRDWLYNLRPGYQLRFGFSRKLNGKIGVFIRHLQKNIEVNIEGQAWKVPPEIVTDVLHEVTTIPDENEYNCFSNVKTSASRFDTEVEKGDTILSYRGRAWDIVHVKGMSGDSFGGTVIGGRNNGKSYKFKKAWYVQKLDSDKISLKQV